MGFCAVMMAATASCDNRSTDNSGQFDVYGRIVYIPLITESSFTEFYIFHSGRPVINAQISVATHSVPLVDQANGRYRFEFDFGIGDTLAYSIDSEYGSSQGNVIIPDTVSIIRPLPLDTIPNGADYSVVWHRKIGVDGYFVYLQNQNGYATALTESDIDTTVVLDGHNIFNPGNDRLWVEALFGVFSSTAAPNGMNLPRGVVGAAGNYREVYVSFAP